MDFAIGFPRPRRLRSYGRLVYAVEVRPSGIHETFVPVNLLALRAASVRLTSCQVTSGNLDVNVFRMRGNVVVSLIAVR